MSETDRYAPQGAIWVCGACGKTAVDRYGVRGEHSQGWDESCMLNAILCEETKGFNDKGVYGWKPFINSPQTQPERATE